MCKGIVLSISAVKKAWLRLFESDGQDKLMAGAVNIVEPTLETEAGHCYSFVTSLCKVNKGLLLRLWVSRRAQISFADENVRVRKYFFRRIRRLQSYVLYKQLLAAPGKLFVSTAGRADLVLLDWAASGMVSPGKVYLYFHWFNTSGRKLEHLRKLARRQPNLVILGPTSSVAEVFQDAGFSNARVVPYPVSQPAPSDRAEQTGFARLLYAGAARQDKGFPRIVDLIEHMAERGLEMPITLQTSPDHYGKYDAATRADLARLRATTYPGLQLRPDTLGLDDYQELFSGAICLQPYSASVFADRVSGVTLDALSAGSPIVATAGTWIARLVQRFDAGVIVDSPTPEAMLLGIQKIIADYPRYHMKARAAGQVLQLENSAESLLRVLTE